MLLSTDLYSIYGHFGERVLAEIRVETYGKDIGQNSWLTADELELFLAWLGISPGELVLEVASGSGGPALFLAQAANCNVVGIDSNEPGVGRATRAAADAGLAARVRFSLADANARLPFDAASFDALVCIDALNHLPDRAGVLREWRRVLRPGRRALFTDPVVITGPVTADELARRSSIGSFLFTPPGVNERLLEQAGLRLLRREDVTENAARTSGRWLRARQAREAALLPIEGPERFEGLQRFLAAVERLTSERRLSRFAYLVERPLGERETGAHGSASTPMRNSAL